MQQHQTLLRISSTTAQLLLLLLLLIQATLLTRSTVTGSAPGYFHHLDATDCPDTKLVNVVIQPENERLTLLLQESSGDFLAPQLMASGSFFDARRRPCFYQGGKADAPEDKTAVAKQIGRWFSGTFSHKDTTFEVPNQPADSAEFQARRLPPKPRRFSCGVEAAAAAKSRHSAAVGGGDRASRIRREVVASMDLNSPVAESEQTYVYLVLVGDEAFVNGTAGGDSFVAMERLWEIGNYINNLYKPIGVNVVTVRTVTLVGDPLELGRNASGTNPTVMLNNFMRYRMRNLNNITHSAAHLVSGLPFTGANVGLAHTGKLCQFDLSGGVNSDTDMTGSAMNIAVTVTHELGHNLGMDHDPDMWVDPCGCFDSQGCIMTAVGDVTNPVRFSNCSVQRYKQFNVKNGLAYCTSKLLAGTALVEMAPKCGNRIVDYGEECDCGLPGYCNNSCCNATTCKFTAGASCASGQCCNTTSCSPIVNGTLCRAARGVCDLPEFCNGSSEWCPEFNDHKVDGTPCATDPSNSLHVLARCYGAECATRDERCRQLFKESDMRASPVKESDLTKDGNSGGYCAYSPKNYSPLEYDYTACTAENARCGLLYCSGTMAFGPTPNWWGMAINQAKETSPIDGTGDNVAYARIDMSLSGYRDPGFVPNGAECGADMMCVNSRCRNVNEVMVNATATSGALPNCHGKGVVTQTGLCYCNYGFRPPDCVEPGYGGSLTNQPAETGNITTVMPTTTTPMSTTTDFVFTTLFDQKRDDFWMWIGIGIGIGVALILIAIFFVWLYFWYRRNDTRPYIGGLDVAVTDTSAAIAFRSCGDPKSYPANVAVASSPAVAVSNGHHLAHVEKYYRPQETMGRTAQKYKMDIDVGTPGNFQHT